MIRLARILLLAAAVNGPANAQEPHRPPDSAPPPLKTITRVERNQIDQADDSKDRLKVTIALAEIHLANAESHTAQSDFAAASAAIGGYWALIEDLFGFLKTMKADTNKTRDLYKRIELALRAHGPRLTAMRRSTPAEYSVWIKEIEEFARNERTEALNSFYGHTVFREPNQKIKEPGSPEKSPTPTEVKKP